MIYTIVLLNFIAAFALDENFAQTMVSLLEEAKKLVYAYTDMNIIDTSVFEDQIHILVDRITHEYADEFDLKMGQLAYQGHISMISASGAESLWPLKKIRITEHKSDTLFPVLYTGLAKRETRGTSYVFGHGETFCKGDPVVVESIIAGECYSQRHEGIGSSRVDNYSGYSMHVAVYVDKYCTRNMRKGYHWQQPYTMACYNARTDNSLWWDWPNHNAP